MIEVLIVLVIIGILTAIAAPIYLQQRERAKDAATREGGRTVAIAVLTYVAVNSTAPADAHKSTLVPAYADTKDWPHNAWRGDDMADSAAKGDYSYSRGVSPSTKDFELTLHLSHEEFVTP